MAALAEQQDELTTLLASRDDADWKSSSRCEGWSVADVVLHLAQTNEMALASAEGTFADAVARMSGGSAGAANVDEGADLMVARERWTTVDAIRHRWQRGAQQLVDALQACDPHAHVQWVAGTLSARTLATTRLAETWIHTGDVAHAFTIDLEPTDRLWHIARLAWRTVPYAFARAGRDLSGPVSFDLTGPGGGAWTYGLDDNPTTTISGDAHELCLVAARRRDPRDTALRGEGPDAESVLELVRTYA